MGRALAVVCALAVLWLAIGRQNPVPVTDPSVPPGHIAVYGRMSCGYTQQSLATLEAEGIRYVFRSVDDSETASHLHLRMEAFGLSTRHYLLPVVDIGGRFSIRPSRESLLLDWRRTEA